MRRVRRVAALALALVLLVLGGVTLIFEGGEVVALETRDAAGAHTTRLWVVDHEGFAWLRTGDPGSPWLARLRTNPEVAVTRAGERRAYRAMPVDDAATRERVNALTLDKYGAAERLLRAATLDPARTTAVRLEPR